MGLASTRAQAVELVPPSLLLSGFTFPVTGCTLHWLQKNMNGFGYILTLQARPLLSSFLAGVGA